MRVCARDGVGNDGPATVPATAAVTPPAAVPPSRAGALCARLKSAGLAKVSPSHPTLLALMGLGASDEEFLDALPQALGKSDGFAYLLAVVKARREQAAQLAASGPRGAVATQRSATQERLMAAAILTGSASRSREGARRLDGGGAIDVDARVVAG